MEVVPAYYVDFQKYKVPAIKKKNKDITEIIEHLNSTDAKYATGLRYIQEDASDIRFIFSFDEKVNYVRYDKQKKKVSSCYFYDSKGISAYLFWVFRNSLVCYRTAYKGDVILV